MDGTTTTSAWLRKLRDGWCDEIPPVVINSTSPKANYKVRGAWWLMLNLVLEQAVEKHVFSSTLTDEVRRFANHITSDDFSARLRTAPDIEMGNRMIDRALRELNGKGAA